MNVNWPCSVDTLQSPGIRVDARIERWAQSSNGTVDAANVLGLQSGMVAGPDCTTMHSDLIDQIYEAAFRSERWTSVLEDATAGAHRIR